MNEVYLIKFIVWRVSTQATYGTVLWAHYAHYYVLRVTYYATVYSTMLQYATTYSIMCSLCSLIMLQYCKTQILQMSLSSSFSNSRPHIQYEQSSVAHRCCRSFDHLKLGSNFSIVDHSCCRPSVLSTIHVVDQTRCRPLMLSTKRVYAV